MAELEFIPADKMYGVEKGADNYVYFERNENIYIDA